MFVIYFLFKSKNIIQLYVRPIKISFKCFNFVCLYGNTSITVISYEIVIALYILLFNWGLKTLAK